MITPSFGLTATERVLPRLALDFTTASLDSRITFTRTTGASNPATYFNSSGVLTSATNNQPRFDYDPVTLACKGLLIEESRINYITYTSDLSQAAWIKLNLTFDANAGTSPSGANDAFKLKKDATTSTCNVRQVGVASATGTYTASTFAKKGEWNFLYMSVTGSSSNGVAFDLTTGAATPFGTGATGSAVFVGNGWWRCSVTHTLAAQDATNTNQPRPTAAGATALGNGSDGVYIWGAQLEAGAFATSYIPTTTTALTRNADVATMTGTNFSDWFNASEGTFAYTWQSNGQTNGSQRFGMTVSDGTANNRIRSFVNSSTTQVTTQVTSVGASVASLNNTITATTGVVNKTCASYKLDLFASSSNASSPTTDTSGAVPTGINQSIIGADIGSTGFLNGIMQKISYWPQRLTNAEVQAFSK